MRYGIILLVELRNNKYRQFNMRVCWNRQTGTFEGRVSRDVWVQVPLLAPKYGQMAELV